MSGRTQFIVGSVMLALAIGVLVGGVLTPRPALGQAAGGFERGEGRTTRYAFVTGVPGTLPRSETCYIIDDANELLMVYEYSSAGHKCEFRTAKDLRREARGLIKDRGKAEK